MTYQPIVPLSGIPGWRFLERTQAKQQAAFEKSPQIARDIAYFQDKIGKVETAADLVGDRRLLNIALTAFGLEAELDKKAFVRKILESDLSDQASLANRLTAPGMRQMAEAFGFGREQGPRVGETGFAARIVSAYKTRAFESAVGNASNDMRLAMNFRREIADLATSDSQAGFYRVLTSKPMREVFQKAFNLPSDFSKIDIDQQRSVLETRTRQMFGEGGLTVFAKPEAVEKMISRFLVRSQIDASAAPASGAASALSLIQNWRSGSSQGIANLFAARS